MRINVKEVRKRLHSYLRALDRHVNNVATSRFLLALHSRRWSRKLVMVRRRRLLHGRHLATIITALELALVTAAPFLLIAEVVRE